jgi:hypothetical protein
MESGKKNVADGDNPLEELEAATAGRDSYVSELLNANAAARREERRRRPRDKTPARRRSIVATDLNRGGSGERD